jgi:hypothetical protein
MSSPVRYLLGNVEERGSGSELTLKIFPNALLRPARRTPSRYNMCLHGWEKGRVVVQTADSTA